MKYEVDAYGNVGTVIRRVKTPKGWARLTYKSFLKVLKAYSKEKKLGPMTKDHWNKAEIVFYRIPKCKKSP